MRTEHFSETEFSTEVCTFFDKNMGLGTGFETAKNQINEEKPL